jgi:hypothetical protein
MELGNMFFGNSRGEVPIPRGAGYEGLLDALFDAIDEEENSMTSGYGLNFANDIFETFPYYWGDCTCDDNEGLFLESEEHFDSCLLLKPNFLYKPTDYQLSWYKYPLRDSYANREMSLLDFADMIKECVKSLENTNGP